MAERTSTCDPQVERETLQVYSYTPRAISLICQSEFGPKLDRTHDRRRPGADPLASKITRPNAKRYVKDSLFLPPLPQDLPQLRRRIVAAISDTDCDMLRRVWAETDYRLDVCRVTTVHMRHGEKKKKDGVSLSICLSHFTILFALQVYRFYEVCQGSMNRTVVCITVLLWCTAVAIRPQTHSSRIYCSKPKPHHD
jgi:hypothetical protein